MADHENPELPAEVRSFSGTAYKKPYLSLSQEQWWGALHGTEIDDISQQIRLRPWFSLGVFTLLIAQNIGIWFVIVWAMQLHDLKDLQLIFSVLITGTLAQSYLILRLIVNKIFSEIDYHNGGPDTKT